MFVLESHHNLCALKGQIKTDEVSMKINNLNYLINFYSNLHNNLSKISIRSEINNDLIFFLKSQDNFKKRG